MSPAPTAVVLAQETLALGLYRRLGEAGVRPGPDLAVVGFRKNPVCDYLVPSLTSFAVSLDAYGRRLGEIVLDRVAGADAPVQEVWPMTLAAGESDTAPPRVSERLS
jgi:DNA-binding LacI/PurR family transcriptional regulator